MDAVRGFLRDSVLHRLSVVHPGGERPRVGISQDQHTGRLMSHCATCGWISMASREVPWDVQLLQQYVDTASLLSLEKGDVEKELLVLYVMTS